MSIVPSVFPGLKFETRCHATRVSQSKPIIAGRNTVLVGDFKDGEVKQCPGIQFEPLIMLPLGRKPE